ncbi:MAG TPA: prolyl oligopeptidase family serine peptidase [Pirellulaceae bacterium]|nr:prolyl oligopeptidase family serine peptidase [Pirellulaceae bacterium]
MWIPHADLVTRQNWSFVPYKSKVIEMKKHLTISVFVNAGLWLSVASISAQDAATNGLVGKEFERNISVKLNYLLYLPEDYDQQDSWPLLLFLHGAGERGSNLDLVKMHGPPKLIAAGKSFPFIVVAPQCAAGRWWEAYELAALLDEIEEKYNVDKQRIYVTGLSMGGFGTWSLAAHQPQRFAAIAPICGGGEPITTRLYNHLPTWVFHGDKDEVVPLSRSENMVQALKRAGGKVKFTIYEGVGHDSWSETYTNEELYQWFLEHKNGR